MDAINFVEIIERTRRLTDEQVGKICRAVAKYLENGIIEEVPQEISMALELAIALCSVKRKKKTFVPPTLDEVLEYASTRKGLVDAHYFYEYYNNTAWKDKGGQPVLNWKGRFLTWENRAMKDLVRLNNQKKLKGGKNNGEFDID